MRHNHTPQEEVSCKVCIHYPVCKIITRLEDEQLYDLPVSVEEIRRVPIVLAERCVHFVSRNDRLDTTKEGEVT